MLNLTCSEPPILTFAPLRHWCASDEIHWRKPVEIVLINGLKTAVLRHCATGAPVDFSTGANLNPDFAPVVFFTGASLAQWRKMTPKKGAPLLEIPLVKSSLAQSAPLCAWQWRTEAHRQCAFNRSGDFSRRQIQDKSAPLEIEKGDLHDDQSRRSQRARSVA